MLLLEQMWDRLDKEYINYMGASANRDIVTVAKQQSLMRGMAEMIALFMTPFFRTGDDIVREEVKRYNAKVANEVYETPGLGSRKYEAIYDYSPEHLATVAAKKAVVTATKESTGELVNGLSKDDIRTIKASHSTGMMDAVDLSGMFNVAPEVIEKVLLTP